MALADHAELLEAARAARDNAYARYSGFKVGAALRGASGRIYVGCNVENATYGATICAERSAISAMIVAGETSFVAVAVYTEADEPAMPCGLCRQVLHEHGPQATVVSATPARVDETTVAELLPRPFRFDP